VQDLETTQFLQFAPAKTWENLVQEKPFPQPFIVEFHLRLLLDPWITQKWKGFEGVHMETAVIPRPHKYTDAPFSHLWLGADFASFAFPGVQLLR
jgi:hypothetical protein